MQLLNGVACGRPTEILIIRKTAGINTPEPVLDLTIIEKYYRPIFVYDTLYTAVSCVYAWVFFPFGPLS